MKLSNWAEDCISSADKIDSIIHNDIVQLLSNNCPKNYEYTSPELCANETDRPVSKNICLQCWQNAISLAHRKIHIQGFNSLLEIK